MTEEWSWASSVTSPDAGTLRTLCARVKSTCDSIVESVKLAVFSYSRNSGLCKTGTLDVFRQVEAGRPGAITVGLARRVAPGAIIGIDVENSQFVETGEQANAKSALNFGRRRSLRPRIIVISRTRPKMVHSLLRSRGVKPPDR